MNITVYCGAAKGDQPEYQEAAQALGTWIGANSHTLVWGAGSVGLMGVVFESVMAAGGQAHGVIPEFLTQIEGVPVTPEGYDDHLIIDVTPDMGTRRARMIELADAFVALPGGPGTLEELSEVVSRAKFDYCTQPMVLFNVAGYYEPLMAAFNAMVEHQFIPASALKNLHMVSSVDELASLLSAKGPCQ